MLLVKIKDNTGHLYLRFFYYFPGLRNVFKEGTSIQVSGSSRLGRYGLETVHPEYEIVKNDEFKLVEGGLSGQYLMDESTKKLSYIRKKSNNMPLIGVGGVMSKNDFFEKIDAGANLVQLYTGFIIKGPSLINQILKD